MTEHDFLSLPGVLVSFLSYILKRKYGSFGIGRTPSAPRTPFSNSKGRVSFRGNEFDYDTKLEYSQMYKNPTYLKYDCLIRSVIALGLIPFFTLLLLYAKIYQKIHKSKSNQAANRSNSKLSKIAAGFVATFIICHTPRLVINVYYFSINL